MQVIWHQLTIERLDFGRKFANAFPMRENGIAHFRRLKSRRDRLGRRRRVIDRHAPEQRPLTIGLDERNLIDRPLPVIPAKASPRHAMNHLETTPCRRGFTTDEFATVCLYLCQLAISFHIRFAFYYTKELIYYDHD